MKVSLNTVWKHLKLLNYIYITGRKKHYKKNDSQEEDFYLKFLNKYKEQKDKKDFYFFDESRFGTHSNTSLAWYKKGKRTDVK